MSTPLEVRPVRPAELGAVAALHRRAFPDYQSTKLGAGYCRQLLAAYDADPACWIDVALDGSSVAGYLVAAPPAVQRRIDRDLRPKAALAALTHPGALAQGLRRVAGRFRKQPAPASPEAVATEPAPDPTIRVVLVAVDALARGRSGADALLASFARTARSQGHSHADLSVAGGNEAAHRAYRRNGWVGSPPGAPTRFRLDLSGPAAR